MSLSLDGSTGIITGLDIPKSQLPAGNILQVVNANTSTGVNNTTATYIDSGLTATITPTSATSKILVLVNQTGLFKVTTNTWLLLKLFRNTTDLSTFGAVIGYTNSTTENTVGACSCCYLDSPATTSATTYSTKLANQTGTGQVGVQRNSSMSTITLMEVSA